MAEWELHSAEIATRFWSTLKTNFGVKTDQDLLELFEIVTEALRMDTDRCAIIERYHFIYFHKEKPQPVTLEITKYPREKKFTAKPTFEPNDQDISILCIRKIVNEPGEFYSFNTDLLYRVFFKYFKTSTVKYCNLIRLVANITSSVVDRLDSNQL